MSSAVMAPAPRGRSGWLAAMSRPPSTNLARALRSTGFGLVQTARYNPYALPRALSYSGTFYVNRARAQRVLLERRVASARRRVEVTRRRIDRLVAPVRPFRIASSYGLSVCLPLSLAGPLGGAP